MIAKFPIGLEVLLPASILIKFLKATHYNLFRLIYQMYKTPVFNEKFEKTLILRLFFLIVNIVFSINLFLIFKININEDVLQSQ